MIFDLVTTLPDVSIEQVLIPDLVELVSSTGLITEGVQGLPGPSGKSAYQLWLEAGNTGSVEDFLASLKGPKGDPGNTFSAGTGITVQDDVVSIDPNVVVRKFATTIGDGSSTSFTITHNLNTQDVITQVREIATNMVVEVNITNVDANTVVVEFAVAPATNSCRVVVHG